MNSSTTRLAASLIADRHREADELRRANDARRAPGDPAAARRSFAASTVSRLRSILGRPAGAGSVAR